MTLAQATLALGTSSPLLRLGVYRPSLEDSRLSCDIKGAILHEPAQTQHTYTQLEQNTVASYHSRTEA